MMPVHIRNVDEGLSGHFGLVQIFTKNCCGKSSPSDSPICYLLWAYYALTFMVSVIAFAESKVSVLHYGWSDVGECNRFCVAWIIVFDYGE